MSNTTLAQSVLKSVEAETNGWQLTIDGQFTGAKSGETYETVNPADNQVITKVPYATREDVHQAVAAAKKAFPTWRDLHVDERAKYMRQLANAVRARAETLGMLDAIDSGNPYKAMIADANKGAGLLDHFANLGMEIKGQTVPTPGGGLNYTRREPFGVVARILPFNHPISFAAGKIASALITGNTVVMKLADQTPLSGLLLGRLIQENLPPGVVNILTGDGPNCGGPLVAHPEIHRVAFTGSVETGKKIIQQAGIAQVTLELGGKNPLVIFPDVDVEKAADAAVAGMNFTVCQGQSCGSNSRVFVHQSIHDEFCELVRERVARIVMGRPEEESTQMGPVVTQAHYDKVMGYIKSGVDEGARLLIGGKHPEGDVFRNGCYIEPTVFDGVKHEMRIAREEIFGPVMSILTWDDEAQMMHEVNGVEYGLCANIWTNDISRALRIADQVESGYVWINGHGGRRFKGAPFGGYKNSGIGKEHATEEMISFTQEKNINIRY